MKCEATSDTTHDVLMSKEIGYKSYKEICSGEPKKVNLGFNNDWGQWKVENNTQIAYPQSCDDFPYGKYQNNEEQPVNPCIHAAKPYMSWGWELLSKFFSIHNIKPNWLDCNMSWGWYDEELGEWTGCMGKV